MLFREKKHEGLSLLSICVQAVSYIFYIVHGVYINDNPVFYMGIACLVQSICLIAMYFVYKRTGHSESESLGS